MSNPWVYPFTPVENIHYDQVQDYCDNLETIDAITDEISNIRFTLVEDGIKNFFNRYQAKDIVELWIDDGFNGASYPTESARCFVGRLDRISPKLTKSGWKVEFEARDYLADLLESEAFILYYDGTPDAILVDLMAQLNSQRGSLSNSNIVNAQPRFELAYDSLDSVNRQDEYFVNSQSYFDAIVSLATSYGKTVKTSYANFHPLLFWDAMIGNKVTINVKNPQTVGDLAWQIQEGINLADGTTGRNVQGTKTKIRLYSVDGNGTPIFVEKEATTAGIGRTLDLGTDRYGEINNWTDVQETAKAYGLVNALGDALIAKLKKVRREYQANIYPGRIDIGKKQAGNKVLLTAASLDIPSPGESLEIIQARHRWDDKGLSSNFQLANYNPAFHRILCPPTKKTLDKALAEVYTGFRMFYLERAYWTDGPTHEIGVYSYNPHDPNSKRFEFWLPNTGLYWVEGGGTAFSSWNILHPDLVHTFKYIVEKSGALYRISLYNEGDYGSPSGYLVAQSVWQATNSTFILIAQGTWGISGSVYFSGTSTWTGPNQLIHFGFDADDCSNSIWLGYHRGFLYLLTCHRMDYLHIMRKYTLTGSLVATWNIGSITDGTTARIVYEVGILAESDSPVFVFSIPFGYIRTANWNGSLSSAFLIEGATVDQKINSIFGGMTYVGSDQYLIWSNRAKISSGFVFPQYYLHKTTTKILNVNQKFPFISGDLLENNLTDMQPMARDAKPIYVYASDLHESKFDSAGLKFDFNNGIWYMRGRENNANLNSHRLTKWNLDGKLPIDYLTFASHSPIYSVPRGLCIVPVRLEKQL